MEGRGERREDPRGRIDGLDEKANRICTGLTWPGTGKCVGRNVYN